MADDLKEKLVTALSDIFLEPHLEAHRKDDPPDRNYNGKRRVKRWIVLAHNIGILLGVLSALLMGILGSNKIGELWESKGSTDRAVIDRLDNFRTSMLGVPADLRDIHDALEQVRAGQDEQSRKIATLDSSIKSLARKIDAADTAASQRNEQVLDNYQTINKTIMEKLKKR